ncbi:GNAT family N-acetyltransferase [Kitasatospora sp. NPDC092286]|uniref:GNAT family N-acetyltransferase n=1 Tax=Kitasatospora sp. NPDC092286 TaxID=3364087 RepID=UPI003802BF3F
MTITYLWRGAFDDDEVGALHAEAFGHPVVPSGWRARLERHSLGWVCARRAGDRALAGFVNVAWDGGGHAFVLDTAVAAAVRRSGVGARLVAAAAEGARAAGCDWLHVDFEEHLRPFYLDACGFRPTEAGLIRL